MTIYIVMEKVSDSGLVNPDGVPLAAFTFKSMAEIRAAEEGAKTMKLGGLDRFVYDVVPVELVE